MELGTEFKERSEWRYFETFAGLFWILALPAVAAVIISKIVNSQFSEGEIVCLIFALIAMALLEFAAVKIFSEGLYGFYRHKKTALIIYEDCVEIFFSRKKFKTNSRIVDYNDIRNFYVLLGQGAKANYGTVFFDIADEKNISALQFTAQKMRLS